MSQFNELKHPLKCSDNETSESESEPESETRKKIPKLNIPKLSTSVYDVLSVKQSRIETCIEPEDAIKNSGIQLTCMDEGGSISDGKFSKSLEKLEISEDETPEEDKDFVIINGDIDESGIENCSSSLGSESDIDDDEIDDLLEEALPEEYKRAPSRINRKGKKLEEDFIVKDKVLLEDFGGNNFEVLPEGWLQVTHNSGLTVYLNRNFRVVTLSKPYFLGSGNPETHNLPVSSIPCLAYKRALDSQANLSEENCYTEISGLLIPITKLESASMNEKLNSLEPEEFRLYCEKRFKFKKELKPVPPQTSISNTEESKNRPGLPPGTTLISFPVIDKDDEGQILRRRQVVLNPSGKSYVAVLHEFLQQGLKVQPSYEFKETGNSKSPFLAVIYLQGNEIGSATATSKKLAKLEAAKVTLEKLIPELKGKVESICKLQNINDQQPSNESNIFDEVTITDSRVSELCAKSTEPPPYTILLTCLKRTFGTCDVETDYEVNKRPHKNNQYTMKVGKHTVTVMCKNKREGKQKAAQTILQALHPQIKTWGSLIRLYGTKSVKNAKEKKKEEQEITGLQGKSELNTPNFAVLNKLKEELLKVSKLRKEVVRTEVFTIPNAPSLSGVNLNSLDYE